jgi:hypothetical protein
MMANSSFREPRAIARHAALCLVAAACFFSAVPAMASGNGPNGINIGFDFNWSYGHPPIPYGSTASFIASVSPSGATLNNNSGPSVTPTTAAGGFVFSYSIGGVPQPGGTPGGVYGTWTPPGAGGRICDLNPPNSAPLTLFNCFNTNSFGQIFMASATGTLSGFSMPMTCLNPTGAPPTGLFALLYQVTGGGSTIPATPLAQVPVDLSTCPTRTDWTGHTFTAADFANIPLNFSGVNLTSGNFYGVFFAGLTPGTPTPGFKAPPAPPVPVPTLSAWGITGLAVILIAVGCWLLRRPLIA